MASFHTFHIQDVPRKLWVTKKWSHFLLHSSSDQDLVEQFIRSHSRDLRPYNELVRRYEPRVFGLCLKYFRNSETAEDVTQETFLKVFAQLQNLRDTAQLKSWIMRIASNLCTDTYRKQARQKELQSQVEKEQKISTQEQPESNIDQVEKLRAAMERLKDKEKEILMLHYFSEMSVKEIAEQLDMGESAIKMRLSRCREKLMSYMNKKCDGKG